MDGLQILRFILAALLVLLVPGFALLAWLPRRQAVDASAGVGRDILAALADAVAISIGLSALLALGLFLVGARVGAIFLGGLYGLSLLLLLAALVRRWPFHLPDWRQGLRWLGVLLFLGGLIAWRFYQARSLVLPAWVDSVHHTLIVRKILEYGGLPPDLAPYLPGPFSYHYGFHLIAAIFAFWAGLSPEQAVLWFGQLLNALVSLAVYRFAAAFLPGLAEVPLENERRPAPAWLVWHAVPLLAALLVNFDFQMPAYYLTWGRYTLLTGLLILGPVLAAALEALQCPEDLGAGVRVVLLMAGLCVTHYFALLLAAMFLVSLGLVYLFKGFRARDCWWALARLAALAVGGVLLAAPWIWRVWLYNQSQANVKVVSPLDEGGAAGQSAAQYLQYLIYLVGPRRNYYLLGMAGVGLLVGLWRPRLYPLVGWGILLVLFSLPWGLRLGPFRPDLYTIVLFFPGAVLLAEMIGLAAAGLNRLAGFLSARVQNPPGQAVGLPVAAQSPEPDPDSVLAPGPEAILAGPESAPAAINPPSAAPRPVYWWAGLVALGLTSAIFLVWGLRDTANILNSNTVFADSADVKALAWVNTHTPPGARFYINNAFWQGTTYRGVDGGYWLLPITGRYSLVPPALYLIEPREAIDQITDWAKRSEKLQGCSPDFWALVRDANLTHVYLHQGKGNLQPGMLVDCPGLELVYSQGGVFIYAIHPQ